MSMIPLEMGVVLRVSPHHPHYREESLINGTNMIQSVMCCEHSRVHNLVEQY